jgi:hypothetical protein
MMATTLMRTGPLAEVEAEDPNSYRFPCKCMRCGLHFNVYSWSASWATTNKRFCPECGVAGAFLLGRETLKDEIFNHVSSISGGGLGSKFTGLND